jgi:hypothetical protein
LGTAKVPNDRRTAVGADEGATWENHYREKAVEMDVEHAEAVGQAELKRRGRGEEDLLRRRMTPASVKVVLVSGWVGRR